MKKQNHFNMVLRISALFCLLNIHSLLVVAADDKSTPADISVPRVSYSMHINKGYISHHKRISKEIEKKSPRIIFLGDSITAGFSHSGKKYWEQYFGKYEPVNMGIVGDTIQGLMWRIDNTIFSGIPPEVAVVLIGTNNFESSVDEVAEGIKTIIARLKKYLPETKILLLGIFPRGGNIKDPNRLKAIAINNIIKNYNDDKQVFYMDIGKSFLPAMDKDPEQKIAREIMPDTLHPSSEGYKIWAEAIAPEVEKLMANNIKNINATKKISPEKYSIELSTASIAIPLMRIITSAHPVFLSRLENIEKEIKKKHPQIIMVGDRNIYNAIHSKAWKKLDEKYAITAVTYSNSVKIENALWMLQNLDFANNTPKVAIISVGKNNLSFNTDKEIIDGYKSIINQLRRISPSIKIIITGILPNTKNPYIVKKLNKLNPLIASLTDKSIIYISADAMLDKTSEPQLIKSDFMYNMRFLNEKGSSKWAEIMEKPIQELLAK